MIIRCCIAMPDDEKYDSTKIEGILYIGDGFSLELCCIKIKFDDKNEIESMQPNFLKKHIIIGRK